MVKIAMPDNTYRIILVRRRDTAAAVVRKIVVNVGIEDASFYQLTYFYKVYVCDECHECILLVEICKMRYGTSLYFSCTLS